MRNILLSFIISVATLNVANARTVMTMTNGEEVDVIIETMGTNDITYKKASNPDGPSYSTARSNVFFIIFDDGSKEIITPQNPGNVQGGQTLADAVQQKIGSGQVAEEVEIPETNYFPNISFYPHASVGFHATPSGYKDSYDIDWGGLSYSFDLNVLIPTSNTSGWSIGLGMASLGGEMQRLYTTNNGKDHHKDKMGKFDVMYFTIPVEYFYRSSDWFMFGAGVRLDILVSQKMEGKKIKDAFNSVRSPLYLDGIVTLGKFDVGARLLINLTSAMKGEDLDWSPTLGVDFTIGYRF